MIILFLLQLVYAVVFSLTFFLPDSTILPWGVDAPLVTLFGMVNSLKIVMWPIIFPIQMFVFYVLFIIGLKVAQLFLGSRSPVK